jgi:hypothetical protein
MMAVRFFETPGTYYPTTQPTTQNTRFLNNQAVETSDHHFSTVKNIFISDYFIFFI